jgi:hypothetical protein
MPFRISIVLLLALILSGCADMILPGTNRIREERIVLPATAHRSLVMSEPLDWFASENGERYDVWLPQGTFHVEAQDNDYWYYKAPGKVSLGETPPFSNRDFRMFDGGIFMSRNPGSKYSSGAYIDYENGHKLLVFFFDSRFTGREGSKWYYINE